MNRREMLTVMAAATTSGALAGRSSSETAALVSKERGAATFTTEIQRLKLRHTWTTTMSSSEYRDTLHTPLHAGRHHGLRRRRAASSATRRTPRDGAEGRGGRARR